MPNHPLSDARLKIEWAKGYIRELENAIAVFGQSKPYVVIKESKPETGKKLIKVRLNATTPTEIQRLAGNAATDLRSVLDYLVCELAILNGRSKSGVEFPIAGGRQEFESSAIQGKIKKLATPAKSAINRIEPYKGGQHAEIWALNELRRKGIHHTIIPIGHAVSFGGPTILKSGPGNFEFHLPVWSTPNDEPVVLTVHSLHSDNNQYNINFAVDICLANIDGFERQALLPFLQQSADFIGLTIDYFDHTFFSTA